MNATGTAPSPPLLRKVSTTDRYKSTEKIK